MKADAPVAGVPAVTLPIGIAPWLAAAAAAAAVWLLPEYWVALASYIGVHALVALGLVVLTGVAGMTSFGQAAFVGLGAYATAVASTALGWSPWLGLACALAVVLAAAALLGAMTMRLSGHYLPLGTLAWGLALYYLFGNLDVLGRFDGIAAIPGLRIAGWEPSSRAYALLIWLVNGLAVLGTLRLLDSRQGRAIRALKGGALMAASCGVDTAGTRLQVFIHAALLAAAAGWLYAHLQRAVNPTPFNIGMGLTYLFMVMLGGSGHVWGAIAGAAIFTVAGEWLAELLPRVIGHNGNFEVIALGIVLIVALQRFPQGLWPGAVLLARRLSGRGRPAPAAALPRGVRKRHLAQPLARRAPLERGSVVLEVRHACKRFGGLSAVDGVSFDVAAGEIVGLIGPNGAGKSTLFNLVSGVLPPTAGNIRFRGQPVRGRSMQQLARDGLARTFQHVRLLAGMTLVENVAIGAHLRGRTGWLRGMLGADGAEEASILAEAHRQLQRVGLAGDALRPAGTLPLGQQRILEIARALASDPVLLLLDEPAAGLRFKEKQALAQLLRQLRVEGVAILIVEHDMDFVMQLVDRLVVMQFGTCIAHGSPAAVQADPAVIDAYLGAEE